MGLDVGSTTVKAVIVDNATKVVLFSDYRRHNADVLSAVGALFECAKAALPGDDVLGLVVTGSAGMGLAETYGIPFLQEVVASAEVVRQRYPHIRTMVDIGGEDAKMIFFADGMAPDIRMNGSCAGGTGTFIDQAAGLLGVDVSDLDALAGKGEQIAPIASRCGVFARTDMQNLLARNTRPADVALSLFHSVAVQLVTTLARGREINHPLLFCGGPLAFNESLRRACAEVMQVKLEDCFLPDDAVLIPAMGAALAVGQEKLVRSLSEFQHLFEAQGQQKTILALGQSLPRLFKDAKEHKDWEERHRKNALPQAPLVQGARTRIWLGVDSGSTTTKIVAIDKDQRVLFTWYEKNDGAPLAAVERGLAEFAKRSTASDGAGPIIVDSAVTGYGEDLVRAAFSIDNGLVETIAHMNAAQRLNPDVSFILDIGGQDMKATFIKDGAVMRLDINEACSSGCGSFIEGFANTLGHSAADFSRLASMAENPCDLGTRCTVFMNSKVKQSLREGSPFSDIAAGLAYSVVKNCLYKVLKVRDPAELGEHLVAQGGTMRNQAVVRTLELLTGRTVTVADMPELMGAYGAALFALAKSAISAGERPLASMIHPARSKTVEGSCKGCENRCTVQKYRFDNNNMFFSGNKCEKIFSNQGKSRQAGFNFYAAKREMLAKIEALETKEDGSGVTVGLPRALNFFENYPFWKTLFDKAGVRTEVSGPSSFALYQTGANTIMSDNICFPAKLAHGHVIDLIHKGVDRIFMPFVVYEQREKGDDTNAFNCPVVSGYSDVIRSAIDPEGKHGVALDAPTVAFSDEILLEKACRDYLVNTLKVPKKRFAAAFQDALAVRDDHVRKMADKNRGIADAAIREGRLLVVLAGRPYHMDPLVQHGVAEMISAFGIDVVSEDIARFDDLADVAFSSQWAYTNRIMKAAHWVGQSPDTVLFVQLTSFGCGPDAFVTDEIGEILQKAGKSHTLLKIDDVDNLGSLRLRIRSMIESLNLRKKSEERMAAPSPAPAKPVSSTPMKKRTILAPFFSEVYSPLLPPLFALMGYNLETLPPPDAQSVELGLKYVNNEVCFPATLIIGDIVQALESGRWDPENIAIGITQTAGQCRASSYLGLLKKAMAAAGYCDIPIVTMGASAASLDDADSGMDLNWRGNIRPILAGLFFADRVAQMYNAAAPRAFDQKKAAIIRDEAVRRGADALRRRDTACLFPLLGETAERFNDILDPGIDAPAIGIVGEIYVKYNSIGNKNVVDWLITQKIEPVTAPLSNFFLQELPNYRINIEKHLTTRRGLPFVDRLLYHFVRSYQKKFDKAASRFRFHAPFADMYEEARAASEVVNLAAQYGEGWLIPAELAAMAKRGVNNAVSLQPFGCIANHLVAKGIEGRIRMLYPKMSLLFLDIDAGASEANLLNRLHFMVRNAQSDQALAVNA